MKRVAFGVVIVLAACSSASAKKLSAPVTTTTVHNGCTPARPAPASARAYTFGGRSYLLGVPANYDGTRPMPMLVLFHGFSSSKEAVSADTGLLELGPERGYIVVVPDGSANPRTWNFITGASGSRPDDFSFVDALVTDLELRLCVDAGRVFAAGHSAGSAFTGFVVCKPPYRFAGVAMVEATIPSSCPANKTYAVLSIHGTKDPVVLYDGGKGQGQTVPIPPVKDTVAKIAARNGCAGAPTVEQLAPGVERERFTGCASGRDVALISIIDGGHPWAGGLQANATEQNVPGARFSASTAILDFFDRVPEASLR